MKTLKTLLYVIPLLAITIAPAVHAQARRGTKPPQGTAKPVQPGTAKPQTPPQPSTPQGPPGTAGSAPAPTAVPPASPAVSAATPPASAANPVAASPSAVAALKPAIDYVIGAGDVLAVVIWRQPDMSGEVVVRPDGRISVPLLNEVDVTGLTPEQLRQKLTTEAQRFVQDPSVTVVVKQINSRRVYITGQVARPGPYLMPSSINVLQLLSMAGGLLEYADGKNILVLRTVNGKPTQFTFNYKDMINRKNLKQNIELKPDDTVIVP